MYSREDQIFVRVNRAGFIPQLGICGPIPNPIKVSCGKCLNMINSGIDVFQVDPETRGMIKLTLENIFDDEKFSKKTVKETVSTPVTPVATSTSTPINFTGVKKDEEKVKVEISTSDKDDETVDDKSSEEKVETDTKDETSKTEEKSDETKKDDTKSTFNNNNKNNKNKKK